MAGIRVEGAEQLQRKVATMADRIRATIAGGLTEIARGGTNTLQKAAPHRLGPLRRSIGSAPSSPTDYIELGVIYPENGKVLAYARIQDTGGTVSAKSARFRIQNVKGKPLMGPFLRIPVGANRTGAGDEKGLAGFYIRSKAGNYVGVRANGGALEVINVLKQSVTIPATGWFSKTIPGIVTAGRELLRTRIQRVLEGVA